MKSFIYFFISRRELYKYCKVGDIYIALYASQNYNFTAFESPVSSPTLEDKMGCRSLQYYTQLDNGVLPEV